MITYRDIKIILSGNYLSTSNLLNRIGYEIKVIVHGHSYDDHLKCLQYFIDYVMDYQPKIAPGETMSYYSWLIKFEKIDKNHLSIWEASRDGDEFVEGISYATRVINEQVAYCDRFGVTPIFPLFNQKIVISKGVYEGLNVDAVRYSSPDHMTGWWLTTDLYDDNIDSLMTVHYFHIAFNRPDLLKYLALPFGFRFFASEDEEEIWFDENAVE